MSQIPRPDLSLFSAQSYPTDDNKDNSSNPPSSALPFDFSILTQEKETDPTKKQWSIKPLSQRRIDSIKDSAARKYFPNK